MEGCQHVIVNTPGGAFRFTVIFKAGVLTDHQSLEIDAPETAGRVEQIVRGVQPDKR